MLIVLQIFWAVGACFVVLLSVFVMPRLGWRWLLGMASIPLLFFTVACAVSNLSVSDQQTRARDSCLRHNAVGKQAYES